MKRKPPALRNIGIDLNARSIRRFRCDYEVELVHGCCHRFLAGFPFEGNELVYSDPPYLHGVRKSRRRYRYDYEEADHVALLGLLQGLPCAVMISGYPSALYDRALADWHSVSLQVMNQAGVVTEKIWFNFAPGRPHWHSCAGRNFTERQRIKRNAERWARRYRSMPRASGWRCCRRCCRWRRSDADGEHGLAGGGVRGLPGEVLATLCAGQGQPGVRGAVRRPADADAADADRVHGEDDPEGDKELQPAAFPDLAPTRPRAASPAPGARARIRRSTTTPIPAGSPKPGCRWSPLVRAVVGTWPG